MAICEQCGKEHDGTFGSGRFCSRSCSNKWVALNQSDEAKARKVAKGKANLKSDVNRYKFTDEDRLKASKRSAEVRKCNLEDVFSGKVKMENGALAANLISQGYKEYKCESCGLAEWLGVPIPLELHHKDGDNTNPKLENLGLVCPNCHSLTDTYKWRKMHKRKGHNINSKV